jgi:exonuclease III
MTMAKILSDDVTIASWNARGLFHRATTVLNNKLSTLRKIAKRTDVLAIQEAHGLEGEARRLLLADKHHNMFHFPGETTGSGGLLYLISKKFFEGNVNTETREIAKGRIARVSIVNEDGGRHFYNVHNHQLSKE